MFKEYYRASELTEDAWHDGIYYTGDVAWRDEDGYFWFVGRADDVIKSSGYRIGPFEVESALMTHPAVVECAITGVPDEIRGQVVKATIVLSKTFKGKEGPELVKELQDHVKRVTAPYKYPRVMRSLFKTLFFPIIMSFNNMTVISFIKILHRSHLKTIINNSIIDIFKSNNRLFDNRILRSNIIQNNLLTFTELPR